uniref:Uncharacterized protein n=1 Tax=Sphaerodactylus townsendi TaxID=933632 RepID=A0ACB8G7K4_9SAUR
MVPTEFLAKSHLPHGPASNPRYIKRLPGAPISMAYQCTQPCLPPPICAQQASTEAESCPSQSAELAPSKGGSSSSISYQSKQACILPAIFMQAYPTDSGNAAAPTPVPLCNAVTAESGPAPCAEAYSAGGSHAEQPYVALPDIVQPCTAVAPNPSVATHSHATAEAGPASFPEPRPAFVVPGSIVSLHPSGSVSVRPGPVEVLPASVGTDAPHFS